MDCQSFIIPNIIQTFHLSAEVMRASFDSAFFTDPLCLLSFADELLDLVQFHQGFDRGEGIDVGIQNILLNLDQERIIELNEAQLEIGGLGFDPGRLLF